MGVNNPPFLPTFGHGAPGVNVNKAMPYYDVDTATYTPYIYTAGAWHNASGTSAGSVDATAIQGIAVDPTDPTNLQVLQYQLALNAYLPVTLAGGGGNFLPVVEFVTLGTGPNVFTVGNSTNVYLMIGHVASTHQIKLPAAPVDGQLVIIANPTSTNLGSNVSIVANTGQTVRNAGVTIITFGTFRFVGFVYDLANLQWNNWGYTIT